MTRISRLYRYLVLIALTAPSVIHAQDQGSGVNPLDAIKYVGRHVYGYPNTPLTIEQVIANIFRVMLSFVGIIFVVLVISGGITWMTAGGNEDKVEKAKTRIKNASVGLVIVFVAYVIVYWVTEALYTVTRENLPS